jgi:hypothetical protein
VFTFFVFCLFYSSGKKLKCYSATSATMSYVALHILVASNFFPDVKHMEFRDCSIKARSSVSSPFPCLHSITIDIFISMTEGPSVALRTVRGRGAGEMGERSEGRTGGVIKIRSHLSHSHLTARVSRPGLGTRRCASGMQSRAPS